MVLKYRCNKVGEEKVPDHLIPHGLGKRESTPDHLVPKVEGQGKVFRVTLSPKKRMKRKSVPDPLVQKKVEGQGKVFPVTKSPKRSKRKSVPEKKSVPDHFVHFLTSITTAPSWFPLIPTPHQRDPLTAKDFLVNKETFARTELLQFHVYL